jgi:hypothetical protein
MSVLFMVVKRRERERIVTLALLFSEVLDKLCREAKHGTLEPFFLVIAYDKNKGRLLALCSVGWVTCCVRVSPERTRVEGPEPDIWLLSAELALEPSATPSMQRQVRIVPCVSPNSRKDDN